MALGFGRRHKRVRHLVSSLQKQINKLKEDYFLVSPEKILEARARLQSLFQRIGRLRRYKKALGLRMSEYDKKQLEKKKRNIHEQKLKSKSLSTFKRIDGSWVRITGKKDKSSRDVPEL